MRGFPVNGEPQAGGAFEAARKAASRAGQSLGTSNRRAPQRVRPRSSSDLVDDSFLALDRHCAGFKLCLFSWGQANTRGFICIAPACEVVGKKFKTRVDVMQKVSRRAHVRGVF